MLKSALQVPCVYECWWAGRVVLTASASAAAAADSWYLYASGRWIGTLQAMQLMAAQYVTLCGRLVVVAAGAAYTCYFVYVWAGKSCDLWPLLIISNDCSCPTRFTQWSCPHAALCPKLQVMVCVLQCMVASMPAECSCPKRWAVRACQPFRCNNQQHVAQLQWSSPFAMHRFFAL